VAIGVAVAFAWNGAAASLQTDQAASMRGVAPQVSVTVQQAAVQAWVNAVATQVPGRARSLPRIDLQPSTRAYTPERPACRPRPAAAHPVLLTHRQPHLVSSTGIACVLRHRKSQEPLPATAVGR
jgi:hypothetical protein